MIQHAAPSPGSTTTPGARTSRAAVLREFGAPLQIEQVRVPDSLEPGSLLVDIVACSLCGTDVHSWEGSLALAVDLPIILGHEMVGRIVEIGPDASTDSMGAPLSVGDRVIWTHGFCGRCDMCNGGHPALCRNRTGYGFASSEQSPYLLGGFSEQAYVLPGSGRVRVPDEVPDDLASMASCALRSVVNAVDQTGQVGASDTVVVQGAGPLGILATGLFSLGGAGRVITIGAPQARLELASAFGADHVISVEDMPDPTARVARVLELTDGVGASVVAEFSGHPAAFAEGIAMAGLTARYVVVGQLGSGTIPIAPGEITKKNLRIIGSYSGDVSHYHKALAVLARYGDRLPFARLISGRYPLEEINTVIARMQAFEEIKPVLLPRRTL